MKLLDRPLAITDVETTGIDAEIHEIIEIGLLLVKQQTLEIIDEFETKIKPTRIKSAAKAALKINGYTYADWVDAHDLTTAIKIYSKKTKGALFFAHNAFFDWSFITAAFQKTGVEDHMDYHRGDLFTAVWSQAHRWPDLGNFNLRSLCTYFHIPEEPLPHRALNGARCIYEILKKINPSSQL